MDALALPTSADDQAAAPRYHAFLLRLWRDADDPHWHASLQATNAGARRGFADLDQLIAFLRGLCCPPTDGYDQPPTAAPAFPAPLSTTGKGESPQRRDEGV